MVIVGYVLQGLGVDNVIIKGGYGDNFDLVNDFVLLVDGIVFWFLVLWIDMVWIYGMGDILLVCIIVELVKGWLMVVVIKMVKVYVVGMIQDGIQVGYGYGLLNYWVILSEQVIVYDV